MREKAGYVVIADKTRQTVELVRQNKQISIKSKKKKRKKLKALILLVKETTTTNKTLISYKEEELNRYSCPSDSHKVMLNGYKRQLKLGSNSNRLDGPSNRVVVTKSSLQMHEAKHLDRTEAAVGFQWTDNGTKQLQLELKTEFGWQKREHSVMLQNPLTL